MGRYFHCEKKGSKYYFSVLNSNRIKEGKKKGTVETTREMKIGTAKDVLALIDKALNIKEPDDAEVDKVTEYGDVAAIKSIADEINLCDILNEHSTKTKGTDAGKITELLAVNKSVEPVTHSLLSEWYEQTSLPDLIDLSPEKVYTQSSTAVLDYIPTDKINTIIHQLFEKTKKLYNIKADNLIIDGTALHFVGSKCSLVALGHHAKLGIAKQVMVFLAITEDRNIPVMLKVYKGNTLAYKKVIEMGVYLKNKFKQDKITIAMDNGFITADKVKQMLKRDIYFVSRLKKEISVSQTAITLSEGRFESSDLYDGDIRQIGPVIDFKDVFENMSKKAKNSNPDLENTYKNSKIVVCISKDADQMKKDFDGKINRTKSKLDQIIDKCINSAKLKYDTTLSKIYDITKGVKSIFKTDLQKDETDEKKLIFSYTINEKELKKRRTQKGFFILITNRCDLSNKEILLQYYNKYQIESVFRSLNQDTRLRPIGCYLPDRVKVDIMLSVIAFELRAILKIKLDEAGLEYSINQSLRILARAKAIHYSNGTKKIVNDPKALKILNALKIDYFNSNNFVPTEI